MCLFQFLNSQLDSQRDTNESKNKIYEEIDKAIQDLENRNQKYAIDSKADKQKIDRFVFIVASENRGME